MNKEVFRYNHSLLPILLGAGLLIYLVLCVFIMAITIDEYTTVNVHATMSWWDILTTGQPNIVWAPNNHVLNTLFVKLEMLIFGKKDWAIRLHILIAFVVSFYYTTKIIQLITPSKNRQLLYLMILFLNPYLLEFFGVARGYAMSIAGFTAAFYYLMIYTESHSITHLRYTFLALFIAIWSNFSALYLMALILVLIGFEIYSVKKEISIKQHLVNVVVACIAIAIVIILPLTQTILSKESFGGKSGLYQDSIVNYIDHFIHHSPYINRHAVFASGLKYIEVAGLVMLSLWIILHLTSLFFKSNIQLTKMQYYSLFLVIGVAIIAKTLFVLFEVPYPTARTELLFSIPFYLGICIAFERIISVKKLAVIPLLLICASLTWHFSSSITFDNTIEWWDTGDAKRVVRYLKEEMEETKPDKILKLGIEAAQYPSLAFYTETQFKNVMTTNWTDLSTDGQYDYLFVSSYRTDKVWKEYEPVRIFKHGTLYKLKK